MTTSEASPAVRRLDEWDAGRLQALVADYGSPLYVLDLDRVRENYARLDAAFPAAEIYYALKANALGATLTTIYEAGAGLECASAGELERALVAAGDGTAVHYTAVNPPAADLDRAVASWRDNPELTITAGAEDTIDRLADRGYDGRLCLRVNPGIGAGHHEKVQTGAQPKFGVPIERAVEVLTDAANRGFDTVGVHAHVGSGVSNDQLEAHREFVARMGSLAKDADAALAAAGHSGLEFVDVGGGFGVPYREDEAPLDLDAVADTTRESIGEIDATLAIEPGRYFVADAGVLLTEVNTVKDARETTVVGVDAGMTTLARPAIYGSYHPIRNLTAETAIAESVDAPPRGTMAQTVSGPICESGDVFCTDRELPASERGDVLAIGNAGAYGYEMASQYNSRPRPASVVLDEGAVRRSRRRETIADVTRTEREAGEETTTAQHEERR